MLPGYYDRHIYLLSFQSVLLLLSSLNLVLQSMKHYSFTLLYHKYKELYSYSLRSMVKRTLFIFS